jgi:hypothetical protein
MVNKLVVSIHMMANINVCVIYDIIKKYKNKELFISLTCKSADDIE